MLELSREQILAHRRRTSGLNVKLDISNQSLERAAVAGLTDSMPRAAQLSIHARVSGIAPEAWREPPLVQVWGLRYSAYVIAERDVALFTLGRLSDNQKRRERANDTAIRLEAALGGERMDVRDAARLAGLDPNQLRYAAPTGRFLIYWDGARQPLIWSVPAPDVDPPDARLELLRRHLHVFGPANPDSFASWAGLRPEVATAAFKTIQAESIEVRTPIGSGWVLAEDEPKFRSAIETDATRLLPSGDTYYLLQGVDREVLVPDAAKRQRLWTSRVWPGAVLVSGEIVGTWRRSGHKVTVDLWQGIDGTSREEIAEEATSMPLPGIDRPITVTFTEP